MATLQPPGRQNPRRLALHVALCSTLAAAGCATPGTPKPPSLNLPELVRDLSATRIGNTVELRYTLPSRSTDKLSLHGDHLTALFCRQPAHQPCQPIASETALPMTIASPSSSVADRHTVITWTDQLPPELSHGPALPLSYRLSIANDSGRSAGNSPPAFTVSGEPPVPIQALRAEGSRLGIVLRWNPSPPDSGSVIVQRQSLAPSASRPNKKSPELVQLTTPTGAGSVSSLLDTTVHPEVPYRYTASRRVTVQLGGQTFEVLSTPSSPIEATLHTTYAPPTPTGLTAAAFFTQDPTPTFAVDLIWQPADEPGLITPLAGYNLYREAITAAGQPLASSVHLNPVPLTLPAFHDTSADPHTRYRYSVTAIDAKGNESPATTVLLESHSASQPAPRPAT